MDKTYLKSIILRTMVEVTPKVVVKVLGIPLVYAPFVFELEVSKELLDYISIDLWGKVNG